MVQVLTEESVQRQKEIADLHAERAKVYQEAYAELARIDAKIATLQGDGGGGVSKPAASKPSPAVVVQGKGGRGRPPGDKNKPKVSQNQEDKQPPLEDLILEFVGKYKNGLTQADLVQKCLEWGYKSKSGNFANMIQQACGRLVKKKKLVRDNDSMKYSLAA
jgi:hypothetical protein